MVTKLYDVAGLLFLSRRFKHFKHRFSNSGFTLIYTYGYFGNRIYVITGSSAGFFGGYTMQCYCIVRMYLQTKT